MARKTYRERYMAVYEKLQKELQKPFYSGISKISIPKKIAREQFERIENIRKQIKNISKRVEELQREGYEFRRGTIELPKTLTRGTLKGVKKRTQKTTLKQRGIKGFTIFDERDWDFFKQEMGRPPQLTPVPDKNEFKTRSELDDWRDLKRILRRTPTKEEYEAFIGEIDEEKYEIDYETGEYVKKGTKEDAFYGDNEFGARAGETGGEPTGRELTYNSVDKLLDLLDSFTTDKVEINNPMYKMAKYNQVQELKDDINRALRIGDKDEIAENLDNAWSKVTAIAERLMYKIYSSDNERYEPVNDYTTLLDIINGEE